jgi:hypothetical protein
MAHRLRIAALPWTRLSDEELLKVRLCDLRVSIDRSAVKPTSCMARRGVVLA